MRVLMRSVSSVVVLPIGLVAVGAISVGALGVAIYNAPSTVLVPAPIIINVPPVVAPAVTVTVAEPPPVVELETAPVTGPETAPVTEPDTAPVAAPRPRALTPVLYAACVAPLPGVDALPVECGWDTGFPALSSDGSTIALQLVPDDGGRGYPGLYIHLIDANTGKPKRAIEILDPNDYVAPDEDYAKSEKLQNTIAARVAQTNRMLAGYRTLVPLGSNDELASEDAPVPGAIYAEISDTGATRVIDPATREVLFQHAFGAPSPHVDPDDDGGMCPGWNLISTSVWWDPGTRVVLSSQSYRTGGCLCSDDTVTQVARMPPRP